ncbi:MAG: hypothetical protein QXT53_01585 [Ignisphaera sp.]
MPEKQVQQQKTKELKTFSTQVVTIDTIKNDKRKMTLLHIIKVLNAVSEKGLSYLVTILHDEKKIDLGYTIVKLGNRVIVKDLLEDLKALLYVGLIEADPKTKKLQLTSRGKEFLETLQIMDAKLSEVLSSVEELKSKVVAIDEEVVTATQLVKQVRK